MSASADLRWMSRALALARRGWPSVNPNPMVGCIIVKNGRVIAQDWHRRFGGAHAEARALARAGVKARGATIYLTLEPCVAHRGKKTPPCAPLVAATGLRRAVIAVKDPNPAVAGRGLAVLRRAGVKVEVGLRADEARELNRGFFYRMALGRPYVILKTALSLDGRAACDNGRSQWITSEKARREARTLRAACDGVLVGIGTVLADNPRLTARLGSREPVRIVLDSSGRAPKRARIFGKEAPTWVFSTKKGRLNLRSVLKTLAKRGIGTLLVEGGPTVHAELLRLGLVDEARIFIAPKLISGANDPNRAPRVIAPTLKKIGQDFLFSGKVATTVGAHS